MLKLNAGFSRKVGEPNYGSRGASINVELEVESHLIGDPDGLLGRIRGLFDLARRAVDEELNTPNTPAANTSDLVADGGAIRGNGRGRTPDRSPDDPPPPRCATDSQVRAIRAICQRRRLDADQLANERFSVSDVDELTIQEASALIDELKAAPANNGNGRKRGGR
jgi:hypothetical protein